MRYILTVGLVFKDTFLSYLHIYKHMFVESFTGTFRTLVGSYNVN